MINFEGRIHSYIWDKLYCEKTGLFYDYLISDNPEDTISALPTPEMISAQTPNPCGYSTGMEDSSLNGGIMLDAAVTAYKVSGDSAYIDEARKIYEGLRLCAEAHGYDGYIARSVSPIDKRSVYLDSSRDQYTNWVFGAYRYYSSGFATKEHKESIARAIVKVAKKLFREVTAENDYCLLRPDGKHGRVLGMWGNIEAHEFLRMPMIYLAAYNVSEDVHWKELYEQYRDEGYEKSLTIDCSKLWHAYCSLQMQYSVRLLYELETDKEYKAKYKALMDKVADYYTERLINDCKAVTSGNTVNLSAKYERWDKLLARYTGFIGGYAYYNPKQPKEAVDCFYALRDIGNSASVIALAGGKAEEKHLEAIISVMEAVDTDNHYTGGPIDLWNAYQRILLDLAARK